jgi:2-deoxy-D-gluconate 3-dehydrogenase
MTGLFDLSGKRAIVTGGTRGLGYSIAEGLMESGAEVVIFGSSDSAEKVAK